MKLNNGSGQPAENAPHTSLPEIQLAGGMKLEKWRKIAGISRTSAWRMRRTGKLPVIVRYGSVFITAETIRNFFSDDGTKPHGFGMAGVTAS